jgi:hypothetical protein
VRPLRSCSLLLLSLSIFSGAVWAQSATASILGRVTDQQGAALPNTKITVRNVATQVVNTTETDSQGDYRVLALPIGTYEVTAEHAGFTKVVAEPRTLEINQQERMDLHLSVGTRTETVEVSSAGTDVETVNPTLGNSVTERPIVNLPLNGRNVLTLALLQPGVTDDNPDDSSASQGFNIGGGRTDSVTYLLDGGLNNELLGNGVVYNPNPDAVAEFRILTSNYTAEYGRNGAGVISVVTKSGTNQFHGSAFDFIRNTDFDSNAFFNIQAGLPRNNLKRNQFGGTFGGPILKDRLFFFTSYQGQRQVETDVESEQTTFTPAELGGDFSQAVNGGPDPNVAAFLQTNPYFQPNASLAAQAIIDPSTIDPAAQAYIATGLIPTSPTGAFFPAAGSTNNTNELTGKIDYNMTSKDKLSVTGGGIRNPELEPFGRGPGYSATVVGFPSTNQTNNYFLNVAYTRTLSTSQLNELRFTTQRHHTLSDKPVNTLPAISAFGIASDLSNGPPLMSFDNGLNFGQDQSGPATEIGNTYAIADTFSWVRGNNTWKFGAGFTDYQQNTVYAFFTDSSFSFYGYPSGGYGTGNSFADFLVGAPNDLFEGPNAVSNFRSKQTYAFAQDEWKATRNLTLTLGIRYEFSTPKLDTAGRTFSIVPGDQSTRFPYAPLGLVFPGDAGAPRGANFPDKTNFAPRIGFAFSPGSSSKTSIRGGIGIFYDVLKGEDNLQFNGAPPFYSEPYVTFPCTPSSANPDCPTSVPGNTPYNSPLPFYSQPWATSTTPLPSNPFPSQPPNPQTAFNLTGNSPFLPFGGGGIYFVKPHLHTPYVYQYNLSVQHELARGLVAEANYVGSSSKGLTSLVDVNPFDLSTVNAANPPTYCFTNGTCPARILNENQNAAITNYCAAAGGPSDCPFSSALEFGNVSFANFNSLEASLTKQNGQNRMFGNTYFTLGYTYGHSIDNSSGFRNRDSQVPYYDPSVFRSSSDFDVTNRVTFSGGWDLPFDRWNSAPKRLVKGWSLYPIFSWRTGFPLSISSGLPANYSDPGPSGAGDGYLANAVFSPGFTNIAIMNPRQVGSCNNPNTGSTDTGNLYFNCAAFQAIADIPGTGYGLPRDFFRGPGRTNLDMTLSKNTAFTERISLELRMDVFNVFNHAEFTNPDTNLYSATFGQITSTTFGAGANQIQTQRIVQIAGRLVF